MDDFKCNPLTLVQQSKSKTILIYCNIDYLSKLTPKCTEKEYTAKWSTNLNELFKKLDFLIIALAAMPTEKRLVFHTWFTLLMGNFKDTTNIILTEVEREELKSKLREKIKQTSTLFPEYSVYVLSDSFVFLEYIKNNTASKVLKGTPKYVDIKNNCFDIEAHTKTLTNFFLLQQVITYICLRNLKCIEGDLVSMLLFWALLPLRLLKGAVTQDLKIQARRFILKTYGLKKI
jgi:hypothetical protein